VKPPSSLFILAIGRCRSPSRQNRAATDRQGERRAARRESGGGRTKKERRRRAKCNECEEDTALDGRDRGKRKVLRGRGKWQTLSCHEALDVFILPQAVLEERSLRCAVHLDRPSVRARARARGGFTRSFKFVRNADPPRVRRTPGFDRRRRVTEIRETEFRSALSASHVNLTAHTARTVSLNS